MISFRKSITHFLSGKIAIINFYLLARQPPSGPWPPPHSRGFLWFLDHTRRATFGRTPLDEWSAPRRDLYLTTHNTHNRQTSMSSVGFFFSNMSFIQYLILYYIIVYILWWYSSFMFSQLVSIVRAIVFVGGLIFVPSRDHVYDLKIIPHYLSSFWVLVQFPSFAFQEVHEVYVSKFFPYLIPVYCDICHTP
jgi:hypothetical protein